MAFDLLAEVRFINSSCPFPAGNSFSKIMNGGCPMLWSSRNREKIPAKGVCLILNLAVLGFLLSCTSRTVRVPFAALLASTSNAYINIQTGWRLTVVTPIVRSGGYVLKSLDVQTDGNAVALSAGTDLIGYEVAHYIAKGQKVGRVRIVFSSARVTRDDQTEPQLRPIVPLFQMAGRSTYLRLIYLVRVSRADHNMAVVAATRVDALDAATRQVQANPIEGCKVDRYASCSWVPEGIAVRPEVLKTVGGIEQWVDAPR